MVDDTILRGYDYSQKTEPVRGRLGDDTKNDRAKSRFVAAEVTGHVMHDVHTGTPVLKALRTTITLAKRRDGRHRLRDSAFHGTIVMVAHANWDEAIGVLSPRRPAAWVTPRHSDGFEAAAAKPQENSWNAWVDGEQSDARSLSTSRSRWTVQVSRKRHRDRRQQWSRATWRILIGGGRVELQRRRPEDETPWQRQTECLVDPGGTAIYQRTRERSLNGQWRPASRSGECSGKNDMVGTTCWHKPGESRWIRARGARERSLGSEGRWEAYVNCTRWAPVWWYAESDAGNQRVAVRMTERMPQRRADRGRQGYLQVQWAWAASRVRIQIKLEKKPHSAHYDDWTDLVWRWWALSRFVARREWAATVENRNRDVAVIISERGVDVKLHLWQLVQSHAVQERVCLAPTVDWTTNGTTNPVVESGTVWIAWAWGGIVVGNDVCCYIGWTCRQASR